MRWITAHLLRLQQNESLFTLLFLKIYRYCILIINNWRKIKRATTENS